jgi:OFA family oxalate/formate antiporter-like MFS transporter
MPHMNPTSALTGRFFWRHPMNRWLQLVSGIVVMVGIASVLCVWRLLQSPPGADMSKSLAAAENAFAAFIVAETLFVPIEGWLGEHLNPRLLIAVGGALVLLGAIAGARVESVRAQTGWCALGGAGAGIVYGGTVARALKRFTDRKASCLAVTAAACAAVVGLALLAYVTAVGSPGAIGLLVVIGGGQAIVILLATLLILEPPPSTPLPPGC